MGTSGDQVALEEEEEKLELSEADERAVIQNWLTGCEQLYEGLLAVGRMMSITPDDGLLMPTVQMIAPDLPALGNTIKTWYELSRTIKLLLPHLTAYRALETPVARNRFLEFADQLRKEQAAKVAQERGVEAIVKGLNDVKLSS